MRLALLGFCMSLNTDFLLAEANRKHLNPRKISLPSIAYIVARSTPEHIIGCENRLPWHLKSDLRRFREITSGHVIIMGRKTHESIGRVLPNRINIVISRRLGNSSPDLLWVRDRESALFFADHLSIGMEAKTIFVVGGEEIFALFKKLFNKIYLTEVHVRDIPGDSFFHHEFDFRRWEKLEEHSLKKSAGDDFDSDFLIFQRRTRYVRQTDLHQFLKADERLDEKLPGHAGYADLIDGSRRDRTGIVKAISNLTDDS